MQEENLRQWQKELQEKVERPPRYKSKYDPKRRPCYSTFTKNVPSEIPTDLIPSRKPAVPGKQAFTQFGLTTKKDFIVANAVEVILQKTKGRQTESKRFVEKPDYGKVPKYLEQVKRDVEDEKEILRGFLEDAYPDNQMNTSSHEQLADADRIDLIKALKRKWGHVNKKYQNIVGTDSTTKVRLKERFETQLTQLDKDIKLLSRSKIHIEDCEY